ncbi:MULTISPECIES: DUF1515 domain-containing protein [unclassified Chelatococcus]|uniref:DUF1515 domain-containing protein n=1 Tax=unclassified Chelatococcus TaxID=2638111 RepID=UPI00031CA646|nr:MULTISPECIES: DUF1515 domain-containing protein [unclassified Chelatococcus]ALA16087.1 hypothetical protein AL346_00105 [Chelatococcus sp. CO-6]
MNQLDEISRAIGELSAKVSGVEKTVARIDGKIGDVVERVVKVESTVSEHEERIDGAEAVAKRVERYEQRAVGGVALMTLAAGGLGAMAWAKIREWLGV